jgi:hypothetical protein
LRLRRASQQVFSYALVRAGQQPYVASQIKSWRSVDNATLSRLTWLWLAYGAFALVAGQRRLPSVCPFRLLTGHRCPLCGLTRSLNYFMRGKIPSSFREHPVGPILIVGSGFLFASAWRSRLATAWGRNGGLSRHSGRETYERAAAAPMPRTGTQAVPAVTRPAPIRRTGRRRATRAGRRRRPGRATLALYGIPCGE